MNREECEHVPSFSGVVKSLAGPELVVCTKCGRALPPSEFKQLWDGSKSEKV